MMKVRKAGPRLFGASIGLSGPGGSGKTYSALILAKAFVDHYGGEIGMIDTEYGRGERYYRHFDYKYGQLEEPFTPERYIEAMQRMKDEGVTALVVDSASHCWEGSGGILEMKEEITQGKDSRSQMAWAKLKPRHRRFIEFAKNTGVHTIICFRAREKTKPNPDKSARYEDKMINLGWQPITNESPSFEFDLFGMLEPNKNGFIANDQHCKTFIEFGDTWRGGMQITSRTAAGLVKAHARMCEGAPKTDAPIKENAEAPSFADLEDELPPAPDFEPPFAKEAEAIKRHAKPRNGIQGKIETLANTQDLDEVLGIAAQLDVHRPNMKPAQIQALERAIEAAKERLAESDGAGAADGYAEEIMESTRDLDAIRRDVDGDESLSQQDKHMLLTMIADHQGAAA